MYETVSYIPSTLYFGLQTSETRVIQTLGFTLNILDLIGKIKMIDQKMMFYFTLKIRQIIKFTKIYVLFS